MESRNKLAMCRLCLCENECFINIFDLNDWQGYVAADVISDLLQFQVSETDGYPHVVCLTCLTKLTDFRLFKECCQKSKVMYDAMFFSCGSLQEHKPESVELDTVKAEPLYSSDDEDKVSKANSESVRTKEDKSHKKGPIEAISDLEVTDGDEFKQEHIKDEVTETQISYAYPEYSNAEGITSDLITSQITIKEEPPEVQFTHFETGTQPQQVQSLEHKRSHCGSTGAVDTDSHTENNSVDDESTFEISKNISFNDEPASNGTLDRWERQCTLPGEKMCMATTFQENIGKEVEKERGKDVKDTGGDGKSHVLTHTCSKKYKCAECSKSFWRNCDLTRHMRSHTGSKPYKCGECRKSFSQNSSLTIHMRSHTGLKPYKCAECGNSFSQKGNLKTHMRLHTDFPKP